MTAARGATRAGTGVAAGAPSRAPWRRLRRELAGRLALERREALLLAAFTGMSLVILAALATRPLTMTGAESGVTADQHQYFAWIRSAAEHVVIRNVWDIDADGASYFFHPGFFVSGLLYELGLSIPLAYQLPWKPVAIAVVFFGFRAYVRRLLPAGAQRVAALGIALFYVSPLAPIVNVTTLGGEEFRQEVNFFVGEVFPGTYVWGYMMTAIAVGLVPLVLLAAERARVAERRAPGRSGAWYAGWGAGGALVVAWLQPWQAVAMVATVVVVEVVQWRGRTTVGRSIRALGPLVAAAAVPLVYYSILERVDPAWELAGHANRKFSLGWPLPVWVVGLLPLAVPAALAYRRRAAGWQELAVRVLPFAMVGEYWLITLSGVGTFPFHSLQGMSLPLAVLAVAGLAELRPAAWWRRRARWLAAAVALVLVAGVGHRLNEIRIEVHKGGQPYFLHADEKAAFSYLERVPLSGGVLAPIYSGLMVPSQTGRETWVGQISWTPHYRRRVAQADALFSGRLDRARAARFVARSGARFLYTDCLERANLARLLRPYLRSVRRFGCATVYEVDRASLR